MTPESYFPFKSHIKFIETFFFKKREGGGKLALAQNFLTPDLKDKKLSLTAFLLYLSFA